MKHSNILDLLKKRKSIRRYLERTIPKKNLLECIEAARLSPSACNLQPWDFIVVSNKEKCKKLTRAAFSGVYSLNKFAQKAPAIIVVLSNPAQKISRMSQFMHGNRFYLFDIGIACSFLILKAYELNIGCCIVGWFDSIAVKNVLGIPNKRDIVALITLGYYRKDKERLIEKERKELNSICKFNSY